ncbi:MAG TPA: VOC family protein [Luteitalea sp.]|nr:VOC family protein [Luteitalea sp.]
MTDTTYRTVTPYLCVADADAELTFLTQAFGASEMQIERTDTGAIMHAELRVGDTLVMLGQANDRYGAKPAALYLWVDDVDAAYAKALAAGASSESAPEDKPYGHRNAGVVDANGITWWIGAPVRAKG